MYRSTAMAFDVLQVRPLSSWLKTLSPAYEDGGSVCKLIFEAQN
ncbi:MAG: hypothetical protein QOG66_820, partial [Methylobacteriaceae bacterium]|nr:hypothetical protein [Methylobacteriaceae bacterium]